MMLYIFALYLFLATLGVLGTQVEQTEHQPPPKPVFATNYHVKGVLSLPYAELNEPYEAWYDHNTSRSRVDFYDNLYKVYQFGPMSAPEQDDRRFGALYKLVYVPATFNPHKQTQDEQINFKPTDGLLSRLKNYYDTVTSHQRHLSQDSVDAPRTKQACFSVKGSVGNTISPQTVLPDLNNFEFKKLAPCKEIDGQYHGKTCEIWKYISVVGDKKNTYIMNVIRLRNGNVIPVSYHMEGYDTLLGSHYDRYDVTYRNYVANEARDNIFTFEPKSRSCGPMPGPGDDAQDREHRSHMVVQNPFHELIIEPDRYDHMDHEFDKFSRDHKKEYPNDESQRKRWHNFLHNFRFINGKNRQLKHYKLKVNKFADNIPNELSYLRGRLHSKGYNGGLDYAQHHKLRKSDGKPIATVPNEWNWAIRGAVTPVKDQAVCGSCWSYGTTGTIEGAYFVKTGKLPNLSQQQLVDCSWSYGNNGCDGGEDFRAYKYIMDIKGLAQAEDYEYIGVDGKCKDTLVDKPVRISGFYNVTSGDKESLKHAITTYGPVTVAIDASPQTFTFYSHGVYYDEKCKNGPDELDHQVLVVGYAEIDGKFVWIVKNSWSTYWGDNGYIMISAENNNCGVMDVPTVPIIKI